MIMLTVLGFTSEEKTKGFVYYKEGVLLHVFKETINYLGLLWVE